MLAGARGQTSGIVAAKSDFSFVSMIHLSTRLQKAKASALRVQMATWTIHTSFAVEVLASADAGSLAYSLASQCTPPPSWPTTKRGEA